MSESLILSIFTPEKQLFDQLKIEKLSLLSVQGQMEILVNHVPLVGLLDTGIFSYQVFSKELEYGFISTGIFEISNNHVKILAKTLELAEEINLQRAILAQKKALEALEKTSLSTATLKKYELKLKRALLRQQLVK